MDNLIGCTSTRFLCDAQRRSGNLCRRDKWLRRAGCIMRLSNHLIDQTLESEAQIFVNFVFGICRSEERRVGKEGRSRWWPYHLKKKKKYEWVVLSSLINSKSPDVNNHLFSISFAFSHLFCYLVLHAAYVF